MLPFYWNYRVNCAFGIFEIKLIKVILEDENMILGSKKIRMSLWRRLNLKFKYLKKNA